MALLRGHPLLALGFTAAGQPRHPLYQSYRAQPGPWQPPAGHAADSR